MSRLSELLDRAAAGIETTSSLDRIADLVQKVTAALPAGGLKDLLSGTDIGHPLHPVLVTVPIGAYGSAAVLDLVGGDERAARRLIGLGIVSTLPAVATGLSDWGDTAGGERRVGIAHAGANTVALALMAASWLARGRPGRPGRGKLLALAGLGVVGASAWLGGHLSYALGIGVDTTAFSKPPTEWTDAGAEADLLDGAAHAVDLDGFSVLLVLADGGVQAIANRCTHRGAPLNEGTLADGCIECPWHASRFRLSDGQIERGPATRPQPALETRIIGDRVQVRRTEVRSLRVNPV